MSAPRSSSRSVAVEDYAKAIYSLTHNGHGSASTTDLAARLGLSTGSVSTMVKRLHSVGLVEHVPYHGVRLTAEGERLALGVIRRHRLLELFLCTSLDIPWEDVHRFADALEHAASDELIEIIARKLGHPAADPHGDPIPSRELLIDENVVRPLAELEPGDEATLVRVSDAEPSILRYLREHRIEIGDRLQMVGPQPFGGPFEVRIDGRPHLFGIALARAIHVR